MRIVMVLTSHDQLGDTGRTTGFWLEESAAPYVVPNWQPFSIVDGRLITGRNPASSTSAAQALMRLLAAGKAA